LSKPLAVIVRSRDSSTKLKINDGDKDPENDADEDISMLVDGEDDDGVPDLSRSEKIGVHNLGDQGKPSGANEDSEPEATRTSWAIVAVVKKKIIFPKRPMPTMNRATK
jgi:hypothetical protein